MVDGRERERERENRREEGERECAKWNEVMRDGRLFPRPLVSGGAADQTDKRTAVDGVERERVVLTAQPIHVPSIPSQEN